MQIVKRVVVGPEAGFRAGTSIKQHKIRFALGFGGLGDFICMLPALEWIMHTQRHVDGIAICHDFCVDIVKRVLKNWTVQTYKEAKEVKEEIPTKFSHTQDFTAVGHHLIDLGFVHFCFLDKPPEGWGYYPALDLSGIHHNVKGDYVVMTPGATVNSRTMPVDVFNGIKDHIIKLGLKPVFLGKRIIEKKHEAHFLDYDFTGGENLIDQTTLLEAAAIMRDAKAVVGLDNGLLHLAACTEVPIVFGYNIADPRHRRPRRGKGVIVDVVPPLNLECRFCQSKLRFMNHQFRDCLYKDTLCLKLMTSDLYNEALDQALSR